VTLRTQTLTYLAAHNTMTLATIGPEGPWAAALFYVNDGFRLYWLSDPLTRHSRDIAGNPHAAVTVQEDYRDWQLIQGVQMEGTVEQLGTIDEAEDVMRLDAAKFTFLANWRQPPAALAPSLAAARVYRFLPQRVLFVDNTQAFGYRGDVEPPF
jgi:uncharacterized protein YhbP (UPF0306 family)